MIKLADSETALQQWGAVSIFVRAQSQNHRYEADRRMPLSCKVVSAELSQQAHEYQATAQRSKIHSLDSQGASLDVLIVVWA